MCKSTFESEKFNTNFLMRNHCLRNSKSSAFSKGIVLVEKYFSKAFKFRVVFFFKEKSEVKYFDDIEKINAQDYSNLIQMEIFSILILKIQKGFNKIEK